MKHPFFILILIIVVSGCSGDNSKQKTADKIDFQKLPYKTLSDYGFFEGELNEWNETNGLVYYEPVSSLFTDYAFKKRYVWMPEGTYATLPEDPDAPFDFPDKTILIKHFYYPADFRKPTGEKRIIETRLLVKNNNKWEAYPYLWNETQTDATLKNTGAVIPVSFINEKGESVSLKYTLPQKTQCRSCHNRNGDMIPIGPKGKQLNHALAHETKPVNQLQHWVSLGKLKTHVDLNSIKSLVNPADKTHPIPERARSYLDVNCGHCHGSKGPATTSGLYYNVEENRPFHLGVLKSPVAAGMGGGGFKFDINPGKGKESIVTYRMNSTHPGVMMPELGRVTIHKEGVELISKWIDEMK